ncbi:MAG: MFS transporter [Anaerolineae bacterium]|nr:MFS transporter [Anaerolineae bacterium]
MITSNRFLRYFMFALLYFAQGGIMGYFAALNSVYFLDSGLTIAQAGMIGTIAMIPFILKIFLGMLSDKVSLAGWGHRKPYIVIGLLLQAGCLLTFLVISPQMQFGWYAGLAFVLMCGMALYDTCTDGYALDSTPPEDEGLVQGLMVGGRAAGTIIVGLLGLLAQAYGWNAVFIALACLTLLPLPLTLISIRETERPVERNFDWKAFSSFRKKPVVALALLGALYSFCIYGAYEIVAPALSEGFHMDIAPTSFIISAWGIGVVIGGLLGGVISKRVGLQPSVTAAAALAMVSTLLLAFILNPTVAWIVVPIFGIAFGYYETLFFALAMRETDPRIAASMYAILMAVANIGTGIGLGLTGFLSEAFGYSTAFIVLGVANLLAFPLLSMMDGRQLKSKLKTM